jgi:hypothetical protein
VENAWKNGISVENYTKVEFLQKIVEKWKMLGKMWNSKIVTTEQSNL